MTSFIDYSSNKIINTIINDFIPYRGLITNAKFTKDEILADIKNIGYIKIEAINADLSSTNTGLSTNVDFSINTGLNTNAGLNTYADDNKKITVFLILNINGKYSHSPDLRKLLDSVISEYQNRLYELIIIVDETFFTKKTLVDIIKEYQNGKKDIKSSELNKIIYNAYPYHNFVINIPASDLVPIHRIMTLEEIEKNITSEYIKISDLHVIYSNDPPIIWLGGREGQVVEIQRKSMTSGIAINYRRIEKRI